MIVERGLNLSSPTNEKEPHNHDNQCRLVLCHTKSKVMLNLIWSLPFCVVNEDSPETVSDTPQEYGKDRSMEASNQWATLALYLINLMLGSRSV